MYNLIITFSYIELLGFVTAKAVSRNPTTVPSKLPFKTASSSIYPAPYSKFAAKFPGRGYALLEH